MTEIAEMSFEQALAELLDRMEHAAQATFTRACP